MAPSPPLLLLFLLFSTSLSQPLQSETTALLAFKSHFTSPSTVLSSWTPSTPTCSWPGISCLHGRVSRLVLESLSLSGPASPTLSILSSLPRLRLLSLKHNLLLGPLPPLSNLSSLRLLFLSHNSLSGPLPTSLPPRLYRLDLSHNSLTGPLPSALPSHLLTLLLNSNLLAGPISPFNLPSLQDLNLSSNLLSGPIPTSLASFPSSAFVGNPALCGTPLPVACSTIASDPTRPPSSSPATATPVITSSPGAKPEAATERRSMSRAAVVAIVVGDFAVLVLVCGMLFCFFWRKYPGEGRSRLQEGEKIVYSSSPYTTHGGVVGGSGGGVTTGGGYERGRMVFFDGTRRFELEDLLRASAEMLGKGGYGTAYKAVLDDGSVVAVKRLREMVVGGGGKREFEQQMEVLGRLQHPNLVPLKAYYYARDERLLVYEYMPGGSLFSLLHANRGPGRTPLDWTTRMRIAAGAARGLAFIHHGCRSSPKLAHGNIKSTNILLDNSGNARISDFGLPLLGPTTIPLRSNGYRAPETAYDATRFKPSHKADVYAFGVLLLELLTGKYPSQVADGTGAAAVDLPRWVQSVVREEWTAEVFDLELMRYKDIEEEMVGMLQIAMACTVAVPEQRPSVAHVLKMIEEIRGGEASPSHESFDSISDSPSVSEDTGGI